MSVPTRLIHASSNGDRWLLVGNQHEKSTVRHEPNRASGGLPSEMDVDAFLGHDGQGPQHDALRSLLAHPAPEATSDDVAPVTAAQLRAGRALLGWSVARLAKEAQVEPADLESYEQETGDPEQGRSRRLSTRSRKGELS